MANKKIKAQDGQDELRKVGKRNWRVRVRVLDERAANAPTNGDVRLAASDVSLVVSVALMDGKDVATDSAGRFQVFDGHTLTFQKEAFERGVDCAAMIEDIIAEQIAAAERQIDGRKGLANALAKWA